MIGRTGRCGSRCDDHICICIIECCHEFIDGVRKMLRREGDPTGPRNPARQHRTQRIANSAISGDPALKELIAENQDCDGGWLYHPEGVVAGCSRHSGNGRCDNTTGLEQWLTRRALLAAWTDIRTKFDESWMWCKLIGCGVADVESFTIAFGRHKGMLTTNDRICPERYRSTRGDAHCSAVSNSLTEGSGSQISDDQPRTGTGNCKAVHR
jgi:hypothetical protein